MTKKEHLCQTTATTSTTGEVGGGGRCVEPMCPTIPPFLNVSYLQEQPLVSHDGGFPPVDDFREGKFPAIA